MNYKWDHRLKQSDTRGSNYIRVDQGAHFLVPPQPLPAQFTTQSGREQRGYIYVKAATVTPLCVSVEGRVEGFT